MSLDSKILQKTESLLTVKELKERYLFGIEIKDENGNPWPESAYQNAINSAASILEHDLDISIVPKEVKEKKDYQSNDYWQWGYFQLNEIPVIEVSKLVAVYPQSNVLDYPVEWFKLQEHDGILRLIPSGKLSNFAVDAAGSFFPEVFRYNGHVPLVWEVTYRAGMLCVPLIMNQAIGMIAATLALNVAGDLVLRPGIVSQSISMDGLSQSFATSKSPNSHAFSGKITEYRKLLFGDPANPKSIGIIEILRNYYRGSTLQLI